jgi:hypothetical protein
MTAYESKYRTLPSDFDSRRDEEPPNRQAKRKGVDVAFRATRPYRFERLGRLYC